MPFESNKVITERISEANFKTYFVGFDLKEYRWDPFINKLMDTIVDFAFGLHEGNLNKYDINILRKAAKTIYKVEEFDNTNPDHNQYSDEDDFFAKKYARKGEIGELILHLLLRDFHQTICLLSKIWLRDSPGVPAHGFDAVHIQPSTKTLWLGESKLYKDGKDGVKALAEDIKNHFKADYLRAEFSLISKRKNCFGDKKIIPDLESWFDLIDETNKLEDIFNNITIPLLCTYSSKTLSQHNSETEIFFKKYEEEVRGIKKHFEENLTTPIKTDLNIILILFPIPCKDELVKKFSKRLMHAQMI